LKEEKGNYENKISDLTNEIDALRDMDEVDIVSMIISNLTMEKMNLESMLAEERNKGLTAAAVGNALDLTGEESRYTNHHREKIVEELECINAELAAEVEVLRREQSDSKKRIEDLEKRMKEEEGNEEEAVRTRLRAQEDAACALANSDREREDLLKRVEDLEGRLRSADASTRGRDVMQAKKIDECEERLRATVADLESLRTINGRITAERDALLEERDTIVSERDDARDELRMTRMQLDSESDDHVKQRKSIEAERDALIEERESIIEKHRDKMCVTRARLEKANGREGDDCDSQMKNFNNQYETLERINRELVRESQEMKLYVKTMAETLTRKDEEHETAESEFQSERWGLLHRLTTMEEALMRKDEELTSIEGEFHDERKELQQQLASLHGRVEAYQRQHTLLQEQVQEYQQQMERAEDTIRELQDQLEEQSTSSQQYPENLEKEMQERLSKRIAVQLNDAKIAMETQIREELEAEYAAQQEEDKGGSISDLKNALRRQLLQAKSEQEDLLMKVGDSQQQFQAVREGFKKKLDKEKNRCRDLETEKDGQQVVIEKMLEEHQYLLVQLEELQENEGSRQKWEEDRSNVLRQHQLQMGEMGQREEENATEIHQLQNEIDELMNERAARDDEYEQLEVEKRSLMKRYKEKDDELQRALDDLENLNTENADYVRRIEAYRHASNDCPTD